MGCDQGLSRGRSGWNSYDKPLDCGLHVVAAAVVGGGGILERVRYRRWRSGGVLRPSYCGVVNVSALTRGSQSDEVPVEFSTAGKRSSWREAAMS